MGLGTWKVWSLVVTGRLTIQPALLRSIPAYVHCPVYLLIEAIFNLKDLDNNFQLYSHCQQGPREPNHPHPTAYCLH